MSKHPIIASTLPRRLIPNFARDQPVRTHFLSGFCKPLVPNNILQLGPLTSTQPAFAPHETSSWIGIFGDIAHTTTVRATPSAQTALKTFGCWIVWNKKLSFA